MAKTYNSPKNKNLGLGVILILSVVVLWVLSSEAIQFIFSKKSGLDFNKPFFLTYYSTSLFTIYLLGLPFITKWRKQAISFIGILLELSCGIKLTSKKLQNNPRNSASKKSILASPAPNLPFIIEESYFLPNEIHDDNEYSNIQHLTSTTPLTQVMSTRDRMLGTNYTGNMTITSAPSTTTLNTTMLNNSNAINENTALLLLSASPATTVAADQLIGEDLHPNIFFSPGSKYSDDEDDNLDIAANHVINQQIQKIRGNVVDMHSGLEKNFMMDVDHPNKPEFGENFEDIYPDNDFIFTAIEKHKKKAKKQRGFLSRFFSSKSIDEVIEDQERLIEKQKKQSENRQKKASLTPIHQQEEQKRKFFKIELDRRKKAPTLVKSTTSPLQTFNLQNFSKKIDTRRSTKKCFGICQNLISQIFKRFKFLIWCIVSDMSVKENNFWRINMEKTKKWTKKYQFSLEFMQTVKAGMVMCFFWSLENIAFNFSLAHTSVTSNSILSCTSSLFTFLFSVGFGLDSFSFIRMISVVFAILGTTIVTVQDANFKKDTAIGDILALTSAFLYGLYTTVLKMQISSKSKVSVPLFLGFMGLFNMIFMSPLFIIFDLTGIEKFEIPTFQQILALTLNGLIATVLSDLLWALSVVILPSPIISTIGLSLTIPIAFIFDAIFSLSPNSAKKKNANFFVNFYNEFFGRPLYILGSFLVILAFFGANLTFFSFSCFPSLSKFLERLDSFYFIKKFIGWCFRTIFNAFENLKDFFDDLVFNSREMLSKNNYNDLSNSYTNNESFIKNLALDDEEDLENLKRSHILRKNNRRKRRKNKAKNSNLNEDEESEDNFEAEYVNGHMIIHGDEDEGLFY